MKVVITVKELKDRGLWDSFVKHMTRKGIEVNEYPGVYTEDSDVFLSEEDARSIGLITMGSHERYVLQ